MNQTLSELKQKYLKQLTKEQFRKLSEDQEEINSGSFGRVCQIKHQGNIKAIKYFFNSNNQANLKAIIKQYAIQKELSHPNIVACQGLYQVKTAGKPKIFIIMEYCQFSLADYDQIRNLSPQKKLDLCKQITSAIVFAHQKRYIHRDLKPANILITSKQQMVSKIADFGCSRKWQSSIEMTKRIGTPLYCDPNVLKGQYNEKCDVYSLGLIFQYIFLGQCILSKCKTEYDLKKCWKQFEQNLKNVIKQYLKNKKLQLFWKEMLIQISLKTLTLNNKQRVNSKQLLQFFQKVIQSIIIIKSDDIKIQQVSNNNIINSQNKSSIGDIKKENFQKIQQRSIQQEQSQQIYQKYQCEKIQQFQECEQSNFLREKSQMQISKVKIKKEQFIPQQNVQNNNDNDKQENDNEKLINNLNEGVQNNQNINQKQKQESSFEQIKQSQKLQQLDISQIHNKTNQFIINQASIFGDLNHQGQQDQVNETFQNKKEQIYSIMYQPQKIQSNINESIVKTQKIQQNQKSKQLKQKNQNIQNLQKSKQQKLPSIQKSIKQQQKLLQSAQKPIKNTITLSKTLDISTKYRKPTQQDELFMNIISHRKNQKKILSRTQSLKNFLQNLKQMIKMFNQVQQIKNAKTTKIGYKKCVIFLFCLHYLTKLCEIKQILKKNLNNNVMQTVTTCVKSQIQRLYPQLKNCFYDIWKEYKFFEIPVSQELKILFKMFYNQDIQIIENLQSSQLLEQLIFFIQNNIKQSKDVNIFCRLIQIAQRIQNSY